MASGKNQTYTTTLKYKGEFDTTDILNKVKNLQNTVKKKNPNVNFVNVDKEVKKLEDLQSLIKSSLAKGFSNPKELNDFNKTINNFFNLANKTSNAFNNINLSQLKDNLNEAKETLRASEAELKKVTTEQKKNFSNALPSGLKNAYTSMFVEAAKSGKDLKKVQADITKEYDEQINKQKELISEYNSKKTQLQDSIETKAQSLTAGRALKRTSFLSNGKAINDAEYAQIKSAYAQVFSERTQDDNAETLTNRFIQKLGTLNISLKNLETAQKSFNNSLSITTDIGEDASEALAEYDREINAAEKSIKKAKESKSAVLGAISSDGVGSGYEAIKKAAAIQNINAGRVASAENALNNTDIPKLQKDIAETTNKASQEYKKESEALAEVGDKQIELNNSFSNMQNTIKTVLSLTSVFTGFKQVITRTYEDVKNLDKSFAEIAMVTDYSVSDMWATYGDYSSMAKELGQTTQSIIQASGLYYQQGLETAEALELTESTMKLATLAGLDFETATSQMTAALRAFHMEMNQGEHITDVYAELAANAAASVSDIAEAMSKTASIANSAGMSFENTAAMLTQMIETTQEAPENLGTAMKTVIARFTELKENVAGTEDSEFDDLDYNKVDKALKSVGISLKDASGQFRDLDDVFLELSKKWNTLDRNSQRYIATIAAGSRQQSRFIAMMENYERTMELVETAQDSAGKSSQQFAKYQDTLEYKINQISTSWEQLRTNFLNSSLYKESIGYVSQLLDKLTTFGATDFASLGAVWLIFGKSAIENFIKGIQGSVNGVQALFKKMGTSLFNSFTFKKFTKDFKSEIEELERELDNLDNTEIDIEVNIDDAELKRKYQEYKRLIENGISQEDASRLFNGPGEKEKINELQQTAKNQKRKELNEGLEQRKNQEKLQNVESGLIGNAVAQGISTGLTAAITAYMTSDDFSDVIKTGLITALSTALPAVIDAAVKLMQAGGITIGKALLKGGTVGLIIGSIILAITALTATFKYFNEVQDKAAEKQATLNSKFYEAAKEVERLEEAQEKLNQKLDEANKEYDKAKEELDGITEAQKKYRNYADAVALTTEEKAEFLEVQNEIAEKYPELISYYDAEGNAILTTIGAAWDEVLKSKQEYYNTKFTEQAQAELEANTGNLLIAQTNLTKTKNRQDSLDSLGLVALVNTVSKNEVTGPDNNYKWDNDKGLFTGVSPIRSEIGAKGFFEGLSEDNRKIVGALIKDISNEITTDISFDKELGAEEVVDKIIDELENNSTGQDYYENLQKLIKEANSDVNLSGLERDLIEAQNNFNDSLKNYAQSQLNQVDQFNNASQNVQNLMMTHVLDQFDLDAEQVNKEFAKKAGTKGFEYIKKEWFEDDELTEDAPLEEVNKAFQNFMEDYATKLGIDSAAFTSELIKTFPKQIQELLTSFYYKVEKEELSIIKQIEEINKLQLNDDIKNDFYKNNKELIQAYNDQMEYLANSMHELATSINPETGEIRYGGQYSQKIMGLSQASQNSIYKYAQTGASSENLKKYINLLSSEEFSQYEEILSAYDITESYSDLVKSKKDLVKKLIEDGKNINDAFNIATNYLKQATLITGKSLTSTDAVEIFYEQLAENLVSDLEESDIVATIQKEFLEKGEISLSSRSKLIEAGLEDFVETTADGITVLQTDLIKQMGNSFMQSVEEADQAIAINERDLNTEKEIGKSLSNTDWIIRKYISNGTLDSYLSDEQKGYIKRIVDSGVESEEEYFKNLENVIDKLKTNREQQYNDSILTFEEYLKSIYDEEEATEKLINAEKELTDAKKDLIEAQKTLKEAMIGSEFWDSGIDSMYNYTTNLERVSELADKAKESLEDLQPGDDSSQLMQNYLDNVHQEAVIGDAAARAYQQSIVNGQEVLNQKLLKEIQTLREKYGDQGYNISTDLTDLYTKVGDRYNINLNKLSELKLPDEYKDMIADEIQSWNENLEEIDKIQNTKLERQKQFNELQKNSLTDMVDLEEKMKDTLKNKYEQEIQDLQDKYDSMEEADNNYLDALQDAIDKQRKLRQEENQWQDLATKERKLALMQRDTSGANVIERNKLEQEVQNDRQNLLDNQVDNIVDNLKEMYELQKETRDAEIAYRESLLDEGALMREVTEALSNINTAEDLVNWFYANTTDLSEMSKEQIELEKLEWTELINSKLEYMATSQADFNTALTTTEEEIENTISNTSESLTTKAESTLSSISTSVDENITKAIEDLRDAENKHKTALDSLTEAQNAYNLAVTSFNGILDDIKEQYKEITGKDFGLEEKPGKTIDMNTTAGQEEYKALKRGASSYSSFEKFKDAYKLYDTAILEKAFNDRAGKINSTTRLAQINWTAAESKKTSVPENVKEWVEQQVLRYEIENFGFDKMLIKSKPSDIGLNPSEAQEAIRQVAGQEYEVETDGLGNIYIRRTNKPKDYIDNSLNPIKKASNAVKKDLNNLAPLFGMDKFFDVYATGGLVDYTGPAWVDGTPTKPEAFLSAEDTQRIGQAAKILEDLSISNNNNNLDNISTTTIGDTSIEIHINVESISSDYDVDQAVERVKQDIVNAANYAGSNVIIRKH